MEKLLGLPPLASVHGAEIDYLIGLVHWLMLLLAVGWGIYFIYALFRFRAPRHPKADYQGVKSHFSTYIEVGVAIFEVVLLVGFALPIWGTVRNDLPSEDKATVVRVVAEQFAWNIHYPGADGIFGKTRLELVDAEQNPIGLDRDDPYGADDITTINQLHLPVNKPVLIQLSSKDVIHSFALPVMRVKQDAIPGMEIPVWFEPNMTGNWEIACAQLCGLGHYRMRGFLNVETQEEYDAWLASEAEFLGDEDDFWF
jgi:cytochrome c oxidase subunit 2